MESEGSSQDYFRKSMAELIAILPQEAGNTKNWEKLLEPLANATDFNVVTYVTMISLIVQHYTLNIKKKFIR